MIGAVSDMGSIIQNHSWAAPGNKVFISLPSFQFYPISDIRATVAYGSAQDDDSCGVTKDVLFTRGPRCSNQTGCEEEGRAPGTR